MCMDTKQKKELQNILKGYRRVNAPMIKALESYGLVVSMNNNGKHCKIYRADHIGGCVTIARTPQDARFGLNVSRYIVQLLDKDVA